MVEEEDSTFTEDGRDTPASVRNFGMSFDSRWKSLAARGAPVAIEDETQGRVAHRRAGKALVEVRNSMIACRQHY